MGLVRPGIDPKWASEHRIELYWKWSERKTVYQRHHNGLKEIVASLPPDTYRKQFVAYLVMTVRNLRNRNEKQFTTDEAYQEFYRLVPPNHLKNTSKRVVSSALRRHQKILGIKIVRGEGRWLFAH